VRLARLPPLRPRLAQLIYAGRIARQAPAGNEREGAGRIADVDRDGVIGDAARAGWPDHPSVNPAVLVEPI
jgi:hypothetical protein